MELVTRTTHRQRAASHADLLRLAGIAVVGCFAVTVVAICASLLVAGIGALVFPASVRWLRSVANQARAVVSRADGTPFPSPYEVHPTSRDPFAESWRLLGEAALWRDLRWGYVFSTLGLTLVLVPSSLVAYGGFGLFVQPFVWQTIYGAGGSNWYTAIHVDSTMTALLSAAIGGVLIGVGLTCSRLVLDWSCRFTRWLLTSPAL